MVSVGTYSSRWSFNQVSIHPSIHQYPSPTIPPSVPSDLCMDVAAESLIAWQPHPPFSPMTTALQLTVVQWEYWQQLFIFSSSKYTTIQFHTIHWVQQTKWDNGIQLGPLLIGQWHNFQYFTSVHHINESETKPSRCDWSVEFTCN